MKTLLTLITFLAIGSVASAQTGSESLREAHQAFLKGNFSSMVRHLTLVLQKGDSVESRNALKLLEKAYVVNGGNVPADFKIPKEVNRMRIFVRRRLNEDTRYRIGIRGNVAQAGMVTQLKVTRYPNTVVLDKQAGVGEWEESYHEKDKVYYFGITGIKQQDPIPSGLYFIQIALSNGTVSEGYVILSNLNATTAPEIVSPYNGETITTSQPTMKWKNYISPQHEGSEKRYVSVDIYENSEATNYKDVWNFWEPDASSEQSTIGQTEGVEGVSKLPDGPYTISINFQERRKFGDLMVSRESQTQRNFYVKAK